MNKSIVFSGIQPTGEIHLGNYMGAIANWVALQQELYANIYCIVDLHAITVFQDPKELQLNILKMASFLVASGIDPSLSLLFVQSSNPYHSELSWLLNCVVRIGWLNRMTQFKDKAGKNKEQQSVGLYTYPVLQSADILLYNSNFVPVGEDQKQHIELCRDIALKFNRDYNTNTLSIPEPLISNVVGRVMSLRDPTKKMSKSDPSAYAKVLFSDSNDDINNKIIKATTDSLPMPNSIVALENRDAVKNLLGIYSFIEKISMEDAILKFQGQGMSSFKEQLIDSIISLVEPIRKKQDDLLQNPDYILSILKDGGEKAVALSHNNITKIKEIMGIWS